MSSKYARVRKRTAVPGGWLTIEQFCDLLQICEATFYSWGRRGLGPDVTWIGNTARISPDAMRAWDARRREYQQTKEAKLEAALRSKHAGVAGKLSAASPLHVSRRTEEQAS
jgi:hypothetical protein